MGRLLHFLTHGASLALFARESSAIIHTIFDSVFFKITHGLARNLYSDIKKQIQVNSSSVHNLKTGCLQRIYKVIINRKCF